MLKYLSVCSDDNSILSAGKLSAFASIHAHTKSRSGAVIVNRSAQLQQFLIYHVPADPPPISATTTSSATAIF